MGRLKRLSPSLINLIAAGEVIERPAAVVKELLENALDAQAQHIKIQLKKAGKALIKVEDNGIGILPEDLPLVIQRYTTSKISEPEDLFHIHTLGFRGEALASIAGISKLHLASRVPNYPWGKEILVIGGEIKEEREIGMPIGTMVEVKDLFFNTPVRLKFLKKDATELGHIYETVVRLGLAHSQVHFLLKSENRILLNLPPANNLVERISQIFGLKLAQKLKQREEEKNDIKIKCFIAPLEFSRPTTRDMYFYVNNRWIRSPFLNQVVYKTLEDIWPKGRYPLLVVFIQLPPEEIDVNVHPTKQEVRFKEPYIVQEVLGIAIKQALGESLFQEETLEGDIPLYPSINKDTGKISSQVKNFSSVYPQKMPMAEVEEIPFRVLGQLWGTYILCEVPEGLMLIDQHAAHERLNYEKIKSLYENGPSHSQELLTSVLLEVSPLEASLLEEILPHLQKLGFVLEPFGEFSFVIRSVPSFLVQRDVRKILENVLKDLYLLSKTSTLSDIVPSLLKSMACHASIKAHDVLTEMEMVSLLK
ncbi:MAG TPA: DNA mismatch repair endonuclease MutL, partial [Candidatus Desulfofervidus auxilii]|nr:DNA mismatch repair endonuclease MutL [Candidatus Desulfofervidus auxilii]